MLIPYFDTGLKRYFRRPLVLPLEEGLLVEPMLDSA